MPFSPHHLPHPPSSSPIIIPLPPDATRRLSLPILHSENEWDADTEETKDRIRSQKTFERRVNLGPSIPNWHQLLDDLKKLRDHAVFLMVKERILKDAYAVNYPFPSRSSECALTRHRIIPAQTSPKGTRPTRRSSRPSSARRSCASMVRRISSTLRTQRRRTSSLCDSFGSG